MIRTLFFVLVLFTIACSANANECSVIENDIARLDCYDNLFKPVGGDNETFGREEIEALESILTFEKHDHANISKVEIARCRATHERIQMKAKGVSLNALIDISAIDEGAIKQKATPNPLFNGRLMEIVAKRGKSIRKHTLDHQGNTISRSEDRNFLFVVKEEFDMKEGLDLFRQLVSSCQ